MNEVAAERGPGRKVAGRPEAAALNHHRGPLVVFHALVPVAQGGLELPRAIDHLPPGARIHRKRVVGTLAARVVREVFLDHPCPKRHRAEDGGGLCAGLGRQTQPLLPYSRIDRSDVGRRTKCAVSTV